VIKESAHRHSIDDDDIEHAQRNWLKTFDLEDNQGRHVTLLVGPAWSGALLEIGINTQGDIIHAMPSRPQYLPRNQR